MRTLDPFHQLYSDSSSFAVLSDGSSVLEASSVDSSTLGAFSVDISVPKGISSDWLDVAGWPCAACLFFRCLLYHNKITCEPMIATMTIANVSWGGNPCAKGSKGLANRI